MCVCVGGDSRRSDLRNLFGNACAPPGGEELWWSVWGREGFLLLEQRLDACVPTASIRGAGANRRARLVTCLKAPPVVNSSARPHGRCVEVLSFIRESCRSGGKKTQLAGGRRLMRTGVQTSEQFQSGLDPAGRTDISKDAETTTALKSH